MEGMKRALLASLALMAVAGIYLQHQSRPLELEDARDERATDNSFYTALMVHDKVLPGKVLDLKKAHMPWFKKHHEGEKEARKVRGGSSMQVQFQQAQQELNQAKNKMHSLQEDDRVRAEEHKTALERRSAAREAQEYEAHLKRLTDSVFPEKKTYDFASKLDATFSIRHALTDDDKPKHVAFIPKKHVDARKPAPKGAQPAPVTAAAAKHAVHKHILAEPKHSSAPPPGVQVQGEAASGVQGGAAAKDAHTPFSSILGGKRPPSVADEFKTYRQALSRTDSAIFGDGNKPAGGK
uniref:Uncharacterized protein n=1 Tax=Hemiselmis andersenii TaxID=464988 RepID=A0A6U4WCB3_HEMAN